VIFASIGVLYSLNGPGLAEADGSGVAFDPDRDAGFAEFLGVVSPLDAVPGVTVELLAVGLPALAVASFDFFAAQEPRRRAAQNAPTSTRIEIFTTETPLVSPRMVDHREVRPSHRRVARVLGSFFVPRSIDGMTW
jgi:hypothetical protein